VRRGHVLGADATFDVVDVHEQRHFLLLLLWALTPVEDPMQRANPPSV
jgi:hypothetical protein